MNPHMKLVGRIAGTNEPIYELPAMPNAMFSGAGHSTKRGTFEHGDDCVACHFNQLIDVIEGMEQFAELCKQKYQEVATEPVMTVEQTQSSERRKEFIRKNLALTTHGIVILGRLVATAQKVCEDMEEGLSGGAVAQ